MNADFFEHGGPIQKSKKDDVIEAIRTMLEGIERTPESEELLQRIRALTDKREATK